MADHSRKAPEVVIGRVHFASMGAGQRCDLCVGDEIAARGSRGGEQFHDVPHMVFTRQQETCDGMGGPFGHDGKGPLDERRLQSLVSRHLRS